MAIFDVVKYKIRVILDPNKIAAPSLSTPIDVEGTVYRINYHNYEAYKLFQEDRVMEILAGKGAASVSIRWDNDHKTVISTGYLIFRSSEANYCQSIWEEDMGIKFDTRPYYELKPKTYFFDKINYYEYMPEGFKKGYDLETVEWIANKYRNRNRNTNACRIEAVDWVNNEYENLIGEVELPVEEERIDVPAIGVDPSRQESVAIHNLADCSYPGYIATSSGTNFKYASPISNDAYYTNDSYE